MSSDTFIAYFGVRFEISPDEIEGIELRSDPRVLAARKAGLKYYWGNFGGLQEKHALLVGSQIGILGPENSSEVRLSPNEAQASFDETTTKLKDAGFSEAPALYLMWQPDL
jgi:hypothetical protein